MTRKPVRLTFTVSLDKPPHATQRDVKAYILNEVRAGCGGVRPPGVYDELGDPMWPLDRDSVIVKNVTPKTSKGQKP